MGDLEQTVDASFRKIKSLLARNGQVGEENTKAALTDPVVQVLGWDIHDLDEVQREHKYKGKGNPVDYAPIVDDKPKMFLEAKPLGANLRDVKWRSQVVRAMPRVILTTNYSCRPGCTPNRLGHRPSSPRTFWVCCPRPSLRRTR